MKGAAVLAIFFTLTASSAWARIFELHKNNVGTYLRGSYGLSSVKEDGFGNSSGDDVIFDKGVETNYSGEIGVMYSMPQAVIRFGVELLIPKTLSDVKGSDAGGTELYELKSQIFGVTPLVGIEAVVHRWPSSRLLIGGWAGYTTLSVENTFTFTDTGSTNFGLTDFSEKVRGGALGSAFLTNYEMLFADNVTLSFEAGYRYLRINGFKHERAVTGFQGEAAQGSPALTNDGKARSLDLTSFFAGINLRFYINF